MKNKFILLLITVLLSPKIWAQKQIDRSKELTMGQLLPDIPLQDVLNYKGDQIDIKSFDGKVVILDFFDTYCTNCIAAMPKLQKLQDNMGDKLQVILVTWQDQKTIEKFYQTNSFLKENKVKLPTIYSANLLRSYFPHTSVPHTAWIYQNKVQAITYSDFVNSGNIESLYKNGNVQLPLKSDFNDGLKELQNISHTDSVIGSVKISGYKDGVETTGIQIKSDSISKLQKTTFYNLDILGAYTAAWSKINKPTFLMKNERIIWRVKDSSMYQYPKDSGGKNVWLLKNGICYERYDQIKRSELEQAEVILNDLNMFLGLKVYWSTKEMPSLVIRKLEGEKNKNIQLHNEDGGLGGTGVLAFMIDYQGNFPPVVDEVDARMNIKIKDYSSLEKLNEQLKGYRLVLSKEIRPLEVLVFEEIN
ncbi:TlpA family protein disulfide reductase [Sphingobacterium faecium]|uniref:TlpA family protein disulfide reductase n=1 Tax=Sphingobacterium faecium TaxID=34087 RepID=UPI0024687EC3|nr:TlpA disulfide reductase family protein [Sphingobacterium faecium]MDH5826299.1 TlpA disulfide reductase family protein [Sphingobacterium faecium]